MIKTAVIIFVSTFILQASGTELILNKGEIIDLGNSKSGTKTFTFDKVTMSEKSMILIPASLNKAQISINELRTSGTTYIYVYNDRTYNTPTSPQYSSPAATCISGQNGSTSPKPQAPGAFELDITVGFSKVDKLIVLNEGLDGYPGATGGKGQNGGDSGGAAQCVVDSCNAGNGGLGGRGGDGGNGGPGGNIALKYSGIQSNAINSIKDGEPHFWPLMNDLTDIDLKEKKIGEASKPANGLKILQASIGAAIAISGRCDTPPIKLSQLLQPGVNILLSGGNPGPGGKDGPPGEGGVGFKCSIGKKQLSGLTPDWSSSSGNSGVPGAPGNLTITKLD